MKKENKEDWKKDFGEKLVSEEVSCYFTHKGDIFSLGWLLDFIEKEKQKSFEEGVKQGRQSIVAEISVSENMDKIERFFLDCPIDYDDKCRLWFDFIKDLVFDKEWD